MYAQNKIITYGVLFTSFRSLSLSVSVFYILSKGVSLNELGVIKSFQALIIFLLDVPTSYFSDRFSRKFSIVSAAIFAAAWLFTMSFAHHFSLFMLAECFNALSLLLFNGAFIAFLVHYMPNNHIKKAIASSNQYNKLAMAFAALGGSLFAHISSPTIWRLAGLLMSICALWGYLFLPSDHLYRGGSDHNSIKQDLNHLIYSFQSSSRLCNISVQYVTILLFMQIIIQYWQPYTFGDRPQIEYAAVYGIFFAFLLLIQSLASYYYQSKYYQKSISEGLLLMSIVVSFCAYYGQQQALNMLSIAMLFLSSQILGLDMSAQFHQLIPSELRATYDSFLSSIYRLILVMILPAFTLLTSTIAWLSVPIFLTMMVLIHYGLDTLLKYRRK